MARQNSSVLVIGGGVAGLTAAHLLNEKGLDVTVIEASETVGGQAKSGYTNKNYPKEHSLRIVHQDYGCFYQILSKLREEKVIDEYYNLIQFDMCAKYSDETIFYKKNSIKKFGVITQIKNIIRTLSLMLRRKIKLIEFFRLLKLQYLHCICEARLIRDYDDKDIKNVFYLTDCSKVWFETVYKIPLIGGAAQSQSSAILGLALLQIGVELIKNIDSAKMFNAPSSEALFDRWREYLEKKGVKFFLEEEFQCFTFSDKKIVKGNSNKHESLFFDHYILSCQYTAAKEILTNSKMLERLSLNAQLLDPSFVWSNGAQFYLSGIPDDKSYCYPGLCTIYLESAWALVSVIQGKDFWKNFGKANDKLNVLSITFSNGDTPGLLYKKNIKNCTLEEIKNELLYQCEWLNQNLILDWQLDESIQFTSQDGVNRVENLSKLFAPVPGYYKTAPVTDTVFANLYLGGVFCRTSYKIPTMEKACESGFHAANALLKKLNQPIFDLPYVYNTHKYKTLRQLDDFFFRLMN